MTQDPAMILNQGRVPLDAEAGAMVERDPVPSPFSASSSDGKRYCGYCGRNLNSRLFAGADDTCRACSRFDRAASLAPFGDTLSGLNSLSH